LCEAITRDDDEQSEERVDEWKTAASHGGRACRGR
jgi:hypothetical protein